MRTILPAICLLFTNCITAALHDAAFPDGNEYDYALDASTAERSEKGFRICFQGPEGKMQVDLVRVGEPAPLHALPLSTADTMRRGIAWTAAVSSGCPLSGTSGQILPAGSLLLEHQLIALPYERRASIAKNALASSERVVQAEGSADGKYLRLTGSAGTVVLRRAGPGEFEPEFMAYMEDQWILEKKDVQAKWQPLDMRAQNFLGIYYMHPSGAVRLKLFALPDLQQTEIAYVPHLAERPEPNRYYLIPLYPLAAIVDVLTVALQLTIWYDEAAETARCLRW